MMIFYLWIGEGIIKLSTVYGYSHPSGKYCYFPKVHFFKGRKPRFSTESRLFNRPDVETLKGQPKPVYFPTVYCGKNPARPGETHFLC